MSSTTTDQSNQGVASETPEFTLESILKLGSHIRVTDSDEETGLQIYCSDKCTPEDEGIIRECRGVVFHGPDIVMKAFSYTPEYDEYDNENLEKNIKPMLNDSVVFDAHEGTLIRIFYFMDKWFISTHRKLDAFKSKWASKESYGTLFRKALTSEVENTPTLAERLPENEQNTIERFQSTLDKDKQYMFLVRNNEDNRIVSNPPERPTLYHVGTFVDGELRTDIDCGVPTPVEHKFENLDELRNYVNKIDYREKQGVIIFGPDNRHYKVVNGRYKDFFEVRGNESSIKYRYLQVRMDQEKSEMLWHLYPKMHATFDLYEDAIYDIGRYIYDSYVARYIRKEYVELPQQEFAVMKTCHTHYLADRSKNKINFCLVMDILNRQSPTNLNHMIRRCLEEQRKQEEQRNCTTIDGDKK